MECKIKLPILRVKNFYDGVSGQNISEDAYVEMLNKSHEEGLKTFNEMMGDNNIRNFVPPQYKNVVFNLSKNRGKTNKQYNQETDYIYHIYNAIVKTIDGNQLTPSEMVDYIETEEMVILLIDFANDTFNDESENEYKHFVRMSQNILYDKKFSEEDKLKILPKQTFILECFDKEYILYNCVLVENYSFLSNAFLIEQIINK